MSSPSIIKRARPLIGVIAVAVGAFCIWAYREDLEYDGFTWVYRSRYYPVKGDGCGLLDQKLGADARSPARLMEVLAWNYEEDAAMNPHGLGFPDFFRVQHQALVRLLALQEPVFGTKVPPQHTETLRADHTGAHVVPSGNGILAVEGTASVYPDRFDQHPWEGYYQWETFWFDTVGRLVGRDAISPSRSCCGDRPVETPGASGTDHSQPGVLTPGHETGAVPER